MRAVSLARPETPFERGTPMPGVSAGQGAVPRRRLPRDSAAVREPAAAGSPSRTGLRGDQVTGRRQDSRSRRGLEPVAETDEAVQRMMRLGQSGGSPAAGQRPGSAGHAGQDKARSSSAGDCHGGT